jgi:hypothetical protein
MTQRQELLQHWFVDLFYEKICLEMMNDATYRPLEFR